MRRAPDEEGATMNAPDEEGTERGGHRHERPNEESIRRGAMKAPMRRAPDKEGTAMTSR